MLFITIALLLLTLVLCWNSIVARALDSAQSQLIAKINENINGKLQVGSIDFSFFGTLTAHQVTVCDNQKTIIGKSDQISIRFVLRDLLSGKVDLHSLQSVTLDNPVVMLDQKNGHWNWETLLKTNTGQPLNFRGTVKIKQGALTINSLNNRKLESIDGTIDFAKYPTLALDFTGKTGTTPLAAKGDWNFSGPGNLEIKADQLAVNELPLDLILPSSIRISSGLLKNPVLTVTRQTSEYSFSGEGSMEKVSANINGYVFSEGTGKIKLTDKRVELSDTTATVAGQPMSLSGNISFAPTAANLNLNVSSASFDPSVLAGNSFKGPLAFQAKITGSTTSPRANGQFSIPKGSFGSVVFTNANGNFSYIAGVLTIIDARSQAWAGTLTVNGDVIPASQQYNLTAKGSGLDSALLTAKDVHGKVNFDARLNGQGPTGGHAAGNFRMGEGDFSGIPFLAMTGNFVKQGDQMNLYNIIVHTIGGTFQAEGLSAGSIIKLKKIDSSGIAHEVIDQNAIKKVISDKLKKYLTNY